MKDPTASYNLEKKFPSLSNEWHPSKNGVLKPKDVNPFSDRKVWWLCDKGHEWEAAISKRSKGRNCPYCNNKRVNNENNLLVVNPQLAKEWHPSKNGTMSPEDVTPGSGKRAWWICKNGHEWESIIAKRNQLRGCPYCANKLVSDENNLRAVNPALAQEWHPTKNGLLRPEDVIPGSPKKVWWLCENNHEWQAILSNRHIHKRGCPFCTHQKARPDNCLQKVNPVLAGEWHPFKNGELTPHEVFPFSRKKVWWKCENGHEWQAMISDRSRDHGCPYCTKRRATPDYSLLKVNPKLARQWHHVKNGSLKPGDILPNSSKKVWWRCRKKHEWQASVSNRSKGNGCPYCSNRYVNNENCLATHNPSFVKEWNQVKNGELTPYDVVFNTSKKVWWRCKKGHEWQSNVINRCYGRGCPFCANRRTDPDNCLASNKPSLIKEWHPTKNGTLTPHDVVPGSAKRVWWVCRKRKSHVWITSIRHRVEGLGCPYCSNQKVCEDNSLATLNHNLSMEWHPTLNGILTPRDVVANSTKRVWWLCREKHQWRAQINMRSSYYILNKKGTGCPYCSRIAHAKNPQKRQELIKRYQFVNVHDRG